TEAEFIDALLTAVEGVSDMGESRINGDAGKSLPRLHDSIARGAVEPLRELLQMLFNLMLRLSDQFCGGGGRGSAEVGDEIGDGEVGFVADGGNDGQIRCGDGAGERFGVEGG